MLRTIPNRSMTHKRNDQLSSTTFSLIVAPFALTFALAFAPTFATLTTTLISTSKHRLSSSLLCERRRKDSSRKVEILAEVLDALIGQEVVMPHPIELLGHEIFGTHALHHHHDMEVWNVLELVVLCGSWVVLDYHDTLLEEMLEDCLLGLLWNQNHSFEFETVQSKEMRMHNAVP